MSDSPALLSVRELKSPDANPGLPFSSVLVLKKLITKTASNGNPFLSIELGDRGGSFHCTVFNDGAIFETIKGAGEGAVLRIEGRVDHYQDRLSPKIFKVEVLDETALSAPGLIDNLVELAPEPIDSLWADLQTTIETIQHDELRMTVRGVFEEVGDAFRWSPAAVVMHHAYRHGLIEHTMRMARAAQALLPLYPEVDADLVIAGILLHDTGKTIEYEGTLATKRSRRGILQGHVVLGYQLARKHALKARLDLDRTERLEHIVLSHQGEPAWGAAVYAATPEAVFVSMIDNLDAKMGMVQRALRQAGPDDVFSERLAGLNGPLLTTPIAPTVK